MLIFLSFPDAGGTVAAEGATYMPPEIIPYKFSMSAVIRGYYRVLSVTSAGDKFKMEMKDDKSTTVIMFYTYFWKNKQTKHKAVLYVSFIKE